MGSWGPALFSDDFAADIRGDWRDAILDGDDPLVVTRRLVARYGQEGGDREETIVFWLALAAAQMETGRLDPHVRDRALAIIDAGADVARWREEDEPLARQREKVLAHLAAKLRGPQPKPKRLRRTTPPDVSFDLGDAIRLRTDAGRTGVIAIVVSHHDRYRRGVELPVIEFVVWEEDRDPTAAELAQLPGVLTELKYLRPDCPSRIRAHLFVVVTPTKKQRFGPHIGEIIARGVARFRPRNPTANDPRIAVGYTSWEGLVQYVAGPALRRDLEVTRREARPR